MFALVILIFTYDTAPAVLFTTFLLKNLLRRKVRTLLTTVGVAIAVGATVALVGISDGFERSMEQSLAFRGTDIIVTASNVLDQLSSDLDASFADRIAALPEVDKVAPGLLEVVAYSTDTTDISMLLQGWIPGSFLFDDLEMTEGRTLTADDQNAVILGATLAENIGKGEGDRMIIQRQECDIVGVYRSLSVFENGAVTMPLETLQRLMLRDGSVTGFNVVLRTGGEPVDVDAVCRRIDAMADESGQSLGLSAMPTKQYVSQSAHIRLTHGMAWVTSLIAIVVGAVGTLNTMLMSVMERVREISILRAIGWRKSRVIRMIFGESLLICLVGAVIGVAAAIGFAKWLSTVPAASSFLEGSIAASVIGKGFLLALAVGLVGGLYPAYRASRLLPSEGLRHD